MREMIQKAATSIIAGNNISTDEALKLTEAEGSNLHLLFAEASRIREHFKGNSIALCSIINAKSGRCPENCAFCAQSAAHKTDVQVYPLVDEDEIVKCAIDADRYGARCFGIVTSGTGIKPGKELETICRAMTRIRQETGIAPSGSLGILDMDTALILKEAGMVTYHHNLETARSFFPQICNSHDYEQDVETVRCAKQAGLRVCSGGILGLGESMAQRIEMAETLRELDVDSVPMNFLDPVEGTRLENAKFLTPLECLKTIAIYRFILPSKDISVCGGRDKNLRELQSWIFLAGASGMMTGNYLTKLGRDPQQDHLMLNDLGMDVRKCN